jgi:FAD/FMN-containing dehydrogenase
MRPIPTPLSSEQILTAGDSGWDAARRAFNLSADQRPAAVALPRSEREVLDAVRFAREAGLRVAPQSTGHNARPLAPSLGEALLLKTSRFRGVEIDPILRRARVTGGALWGDVVPAAYEHGLAALHGSSPTVGVTGYSLGGGIGWLARRHGLQTNSLTAVELVTADGELVRVDEDHEPELFDALRGGGGDFGVVTALEFDLYPVQHAYAGWLAWCWREALPVLRRWSDWAAEAPEAVTTSARILRLPPDPVLPEEVRGRALVAIDGAVLGDDHEAEALMAPLRELGPEIDTFERVPATALARLHKDLEGPTTAITDDRLLSDLPSEAVDAFVGAAGPDSDSTLMIAELRQLGGALARTPERHGVLPRLDGNYLLFACAIPHGTGTAVAGRAHAERLTRALDPWSSGRRYQNFAERPLGPDAFFEPEALARLAAIKAEVDPDGVFRANHPVTADAPPQACNEPRPYHRARCSSPVGAGPGSRVCPGARSESRWRVR